RWEAPETVLGAAPTGIILALRRPASECEKRSRIFASNHDNPAVNITVILCTYNRCASLTKALESIMASKMPKAEEWHVLVVDNNSKDQTRDVVEQFCRRYPGRLRYLFEGQQGKSYALNAGIRASDGDVMAFMDDDVTVDPLWLQNLTAPLQNGDWAGAGGRTLSAPPYFVAPLLTLGT